MRAIGYGYGTNGTVVKSTLYFHNDPGYVDTARMLVESGLSLSLNDRCKETKGGHHTPASGLKDVVLDRLIDTGCKYEDEIV